MTDKKISLQLKKSWKWFYLYDRDDRYANQKEVANFLTENTDTESLPKLYFNSKDLSF